jgi:2-(1,2-epoxy-1,2-dihydrophenyl)acetyl-CoA isomerase
MEYHKPSHIIDCERRRHEASGSRTQWVSWSDSMSAHGLEDGTVLHRVDGGVSWITLNRPDAGNSLTPTQRDTVIDLLASSDTEQGVRVVVITARGKHFCTGADLRSSPGDGQEGDTVDPGPPTGSIMRTLASGSQRLITSVLDCQKPVVAAVNGTAAGIGAHLALACDLIVAAEEASFIEVFVRRGILPDGAGAYLLPRLVGLQRAKELVFLGERLSAADAHSFGMVNRVVPGTELEGAATELAARLAHAPTVAIGLAKRLLNRSLDLDRESALFEESMAQELVTRTDDAKEGIESFVERRDATFTGR